MSEIVIDGYSDADKIPGFYAETKYGAGPINLQTIPLILLLVGLLATGAVMTPDVDVMEATSKEDAEFWAGRGGELSRMAYKAFDQGLSGVKLMLASAAPAAGAVAATATITLNNIASTTGTIKYRVGGELVDVLIPANTSPNDAATLIATRFSQFPRLAVTATVAANVVTLVVRSAGERGNDFILWQDATKKPAVMTSTIAGGALVTGGGVRFAGGVGVESLSLLTALLFPARYHRLAIAQNDATSAATWEAHIDAKAGVLEGRMEHPVLGHNGTLSSATSIAQTTLNNPRCQLVWLLNSETHPSELAAAMAARRASKEQTQPNSGYDGAVLKTCAPQAARADWPNRTTQQSALDSGVTPLTTNEQGQVVVIRAITTRSLDGNTPDYRTLDVSEAVVPDYVRDRLRIVWVTEFLIANPNVAPDPLPGEKDRPEGVGTPKLWSQRAHAELQKMEKERILTQVDLAQNRPISTWNNAGKRIMSAVPVVPLPIQHAIGVSIRQTALAA
ncbi:MAG: hypothetical protein HOV80_07730 [Polyangiaceae bacterium]|nr:hypothetical protein [Polyangiaceae bacterium]